MAFLCQLVETLEVLLRSIHVQLPRRQVERPQPYLNARSQSGEKIITADPDRFPLVQRLWRFFLTGSYSVTQLLDIATDQMGLRTLQRKRRCGMPLVVSGLYRLLTNPFYAGQIVHLGQWYQGKHSAMVSMEEFDRVQALLGNGARARPIRHSFAYTGLIRCGNRGCSVTAEEHVNTLRVTLRLLSLHEEKASRAVRRAVPRRATPWSGKSWVSSTASV